MRIHEHVEFMYKLCVLRKGDVLTFQANGAFELVFQPYKTFITRSDEHIRR